MNDASAPPPSALDSPLLDLRGLPPPEPMQRVLQALAALPPRTVLRVHLQREPVFLYEMIEPDDWRRSSRQLAPDHWEICIWREEEA